MSAFKSIGVGTIAEEFGKEMGSADRNGCFSPASGPNFVSRTVGRSPGFLAVAGPRVPPRDGDVLGQ